MKTTETSQASASPTRHEQCRREALKQFGRFAATVPVAMLLLSPREGHAGGRRHRRHSSRGGYEG
jgi:hypothetical protein